MTSNYCPCSGLGLESVTLVVDRPYYPSAGERTERKKTGVCPCACGEKGYKKPMTGEERIRMLKAKIAGNCCAGEGTPRLCTPQLCAWPANLATR